MHHFIRYWTLDAGALMRLGGDSPRCSTYLMGNHTIAERMYRLDQGVMHSRRITGVFELRDERIVRFKAYLDRAQALQAAGVRE